MRRADDNRGGGGVDEICFTILCPHEPLRER